MWNPDRYRDRDYGLKGDEPFEPDDRVDEVFVPGAAEPYIQTVLGPISPEDVGIALVSEHLYSRSIFSESDRTDFQLTDRDAALVNLETFFTVGGRTIVDTTSERKGRSVRALEWLAQHAPINVVASISLGSGGTPDELSDSHNMEREVPSKRDGTSAKPGMLTCSMRTEVDAKRSTGSLRLTANRQMQTKLPVMLQVGPSPAAAEIPKTAIQMGIGANQLIVGNDFWSRSESRAYDIVQLGTFLLFDGLGDPERGSDQETAALVARLVQRGHLNQILLSHGFERRSLLTGYEGRPGYGYIIEQFAIMLLEAGLSAQDVRVMLVDNCATALSIRPNLTEQNA